MVIAKLEEAAKIYEQIKELDRQIIEIEKMALLAANADIKASFQLDIEDLEKKKEEESKVEFDSDGSIVKPDIKPESFFDIFSSMAQQCGTKKPKKSTTESIIKTDISESVTLQLLAVILYDVQSKRTLLLDSLRKSGVIIS